jgi:anti-sigma factor RsiW
MREHRVPLAEFLAGELDAASNRRIDEHLLSCENCWAAVQQDRAGRALASGLREPADADLADRIRLTIELAPPSARVRPVGAGSRRPHRAATTAFAVLALVLGALTALTVVSQHTPRHTGDSTALRQIVALTQRLPTSTAMTSDAVEIDTAHPLHRDEPDITVRTYAYRGEAALVATAAHPFTMPPDALMPTGRTMPWTVTRGTVTLYCPHADVLLASRTSSRQLAALAAALHLT